MGLEVVVRPRVVPDFRPREVRDARLPTSFLQGRLVITGGGGELVELTSSFRQSVQKQHQSEEFRVFDIIRIFHVEPAGEGPGGRPGHIDYKLPLQPGESIDHSIFQDQEVMWQIIHVDHKGTARRQAFKRPKETDWKKGNMEVIETDIIRKTKGQKNLVELVSVNPNKVMA